MPTSYPSSSRIYQPSLKFAWTERIKDGQPERTLATLPGVTTTGGLTGNGTPRWVYPWDGLSDRGYEAAYQTALDCARTAAGHWQERGEAATVKRRTILGVPRRPATTAKDAESLVKTVAKSTGVQVSRLSETEMSQASMAYDSPYTPCVYYAVSANENDPHSNRKLYSAAPAVEETDIPGIGNAILIDIDTHSTKVGRFLSEESRRRIKYTWKRSHDLSNSIDGLPLTYPDAPRKQIKAEREKLLGRSIFTETSEDVVSTIKDRQAGLISQEDFQSRMEGLRRSASSSGRPEAYPFVAPWEVKGDTLSTAKSRQAK